VILPTKHVPPGHSLLDAGGVILSALTVPTTVSTLWEHVRPEESVHDYERFVLALDLLFLLKAIDYRDGIVYRRGK
jgi:ABC-3C biological conflict system middle component